MDDGTCHYNVKRMDLSPRFSFGMSAGTQIMHSDKRKLPPHLVRESSSPGPGAYEAPETILTKRRDKRSLQETTWQKVRQGFIDIPQSNPGPGHYSPGSRTTHDFPSPRSKEPGMSFPLGPKDAMNASISRNHNPGPGTHEIYGMRTHTFNKVHLGEREPDYVDDKSVPIIDNGVPGPGAYKPNDGLPIPSFKISKRSPRTKQFKDWKEMTEIKNPPGPMTYKPEVSGWSKGTKIATSQRGDDKGSFMNSPAPNRYRLLGDFDFKDPLNPKDSLGKNYRAYLGIKPQIKPHGIENPGPGTYETDVYPMNQKNTAV